MSKVQRNSNKAGSVLWLAVIAIFVVGGIALFVIRASGGAAFESKGSASTSGVVVEGAEVALGDVPLNVTVTPSWTLINESTAPITLGEPHASVVEGCCPGPLTLSATTLAPGEKAKLTFPLQMHAGMEGAHKFDVHVPVGEGSDYLTLAVTGDFG